MAPDGAAPPSSVQETARNLVGCVSLHRTVGRLRTLPWDAEARAPPLRDSTLTGSSTPPYHTPSSELVAGTKAGGPGGARRTGRNDDTALRAPSPHTVGGRMTRTET